MLRIAAEHISLRLVTKRRSARRAETRRAHSSVSDQ